MQIPKTKLDSLTLCSMIQVSYLKFHITSSNPLYAYHIMYDTYIDQWVHITKKYRFLSNLKQGKEGSIDDFIF